MGQERYTPYGGMTNEQCYTLVMRGRSQFWIQVYYARVEETRFGEELQRQVENWRRKNLNPPNFSTDPLDLIYSHCLPLLRELAPDTSLDGLTLEDFVHSPMYRMELVSAGSGGDICIEGADKCMDAPSYNISPTPMTALPQSCRALPRFPASSISIEPDEDNWDPLRVLQGNVKTAQGHLYFKPRLSGREKEFEREIAILHRINEAGLRGGAIRLPNLVGIVVSTNEETGDVEATTTVIGMLMNFITPSPMGSVLLSPGFWGKYELHKKWEEQVTATVEVLHAHDIVWGDVNTCNVAIDEALNAWVIDFGGMNNADFVDDDKAETVEGDWQGVRRLFGEWLPGQPVS